LPTILIARATPGTLPHFPDCVVLRDGRLLCVFRESTGHVRADGRIMLVESADAGVTWSEPRVVVDGAYDDRDPKIMQMSDGTVLLSYFVLEWLSEVPYEVRGTYVVRSTDGGRKWSAPLRIGEREGQLRWAFCHGAPVELPGGDLLIPLYGVDPAQPAGGKRRDHAFVVRSTDGGHTWPADTAVRLAESADIDFQEPTLVVLPAGELVALIRTTAEHAYLARSSDGGHTWTAPEETDLPASSHHILPLSDGGVLVAYGDLSHRFSPRRSTVARLVAQPERSWNGWPDIPLYDSGHYDQANPSSVETEPGRYLTVGFDVPDAAVVGVFTSREDYARR
jgi:predicted neuraminidase